MKLKSTKMGQLSSKESKPAIFRINDKDIPEVLVDSHAVDLVGVEDAAHEKEAEALPEVVPHQLVQVVRVPLEVPVDGVAHARGVRPLRAHLVIATVVRFKWICKIDLP